MRKLIITLVIVLIASVAFAATIKVRRDSTTNWGSTDPTLAAGEIGYDTDLNQIKVGTGSDAWSVLDFLEDADTAGTVATSAEINTGTDNAKFVSADALAGSNIGSKEAAWTIYDSDTDTAVADGKQAFVVPSSMVGMELIDVTCSVADLNSAASDATTVVIRRVRGATAVDMTSTGVTITYTDYTASDETVNTANDELALGDKLYVDVNTVTTAAQKGLGCSAVFRLP